MKNQKSLWIVALTFILLLSCFSVALPSACAFDIPAAHRNIASIVSYNGEITNVNYTIGEDSDYAIMETFHWPTLPETAIIVGEMTGLSTGKIWVNCAKTDAAYANFGMLVYTSTSATGPWNLVGTFWVTSTIMEWREIGTYSEPGFPWPNDDPPEGYSQPFTHIAIAIQTTDPVNSAHAKVAAVIAEGAYPITPPPSGFPIAILLRDTNGNPVPGDIYLDGYLVGSTSMTINLPFWYDTGHYYELYVVPYDQSNVFQYYVSSMGDYAAVNPISFRVIAPAGIAAVFTPST